MKFIPSNPLVYVVILVAIFLLGLLFGNMVAHKPKTLVKEKFDDAYYGLPSTVKEFDNSPKVLPAVPNNPGVSDHDDFCQKFNC